jgi:hypothetical protein
MANLTRLYHGTGDNDYFSVPYSDGDVTVVIQRTKQDLKNGVRGKAVACMDARCIVRNRQSFPHPVEQAYVTRSSVYIVDQVSENGSPIHAIRYAHNDRGGPGTFDVRGGASILKRSGEAEKNITIKPPRTKRPTGTHEKGIKRTLRRPGKRAIDPALKRAAVAGLRPDLIPG